MDGAHSVSGGGNEGPLVIQRQHTMPQRRLTFDTSKGTITIEREEFRTPTVLERLHRRRGYKQPYALQDTWGFTVDVAVVTMVFWSLSGICWRGTQDDSRLGRAVVRGWVGTVRCLCALI
jgi:hypothetical protein